MQARRTSAHVATKIVIASIAGLAAIALAQAERAGPSPEQLNITSSYYQAFCRLPSDEEEAHWKKQGSRTVPQLVAAHRDYLKQNREFREETIISSYMIVFGRLPTDDELRLWSKVTEQKGATCLELIETHLQYKRLQPALFERNDPKDYMDFLAGRR